jgi:CRP/FNR family transcriptional regulator, anaerobic regulatory protein
MSETIEWRDECNQSTGTAAYAAPRLSGCASMADLLRLMGAQSADLAAAAAMPLVMRRLRAGATLYHEGAEAESIYFVRAGTFKCYRTAEDGYEQVLGFTSRAEVLGFDAICMGHHPTAAVALEDSSVYVVPVPDIFTLGQRIPALDRVLHLAVSSQLTHHEEIADLMAPVAAEVRLARFLMQLSQRMAACGQSPRRFYLRMSRRDIARYLGVAHETVSRSFSALAGWDCVRVENREVEILDLHRLKDYARSTRRQTDEPDAPSSMGLAFVRPSMGRSVPCGVAGS